jgi:UDP-N-acetylmuramoyl-L-alanyl-D-glutamate--2,6-diaminopimelate ligase
MNDPVTTSPTAPGTTLAQLTRAIPGATLHGDPSTLVRDVRHDSRDVEAGDLFVARPGARTDGARFVHDALARGAAAVLTARPLELDVPQIVAPAIERALALASSTVWSHPTRSIDVIGITGTNGKTTTAWLVEHALARLGARPGLLGTVAQRFGSRSWPAVHTTPEADDLTRRFAAMRNDGATHVVMEVSSHALALERVAAVHFRVAALTNVTQDHLDFHGTMERYIAAKRRLFEELSPRTSVLNLDDDTGADLAQTIPEAITYGREAPAAHLRLREGGASRDGIEALVLTPEGEVVLRSPLVGTHNVENLLCALGILGALGYPYARAADALADAPGAPGRLERVSTPKPTVPFTVLVDYAHTPDALERVLATVRAMTPGRVVCVFGCGGDRDPSKRPQMGAAVARGADFAIVTNDNPRTENPVHIADAVLQGLRSVRPDRYAVLLDRREAITAAIAMAGHGDTVLIAGKGHEPYQEVHGVRLPFDDRDVARAALAARETKP